MDHTNFSFPLLLLGAIILLHSVLEDRGAAEGGSGQPLSMWTLMLLYLTALAHKGHVMISSASRVHAMSRTPVMNGGIL